MVRLFLDNTVYNYLAVPPEHMKTKTELLEDTLRKKSRAKSLLVIGSIGLLDEILRTARSKPDKYSRMISLFWEFIDYHLLRPWRQRLFEELERGQAIPPSRLYLDRTIVDSGRELTKDISEVLGFIRGFEKEDARKEWEPVFASFGRAIKRTPQSDIKRKMESLRSGFRDLVQACFERFCKDAGIRSEGLEISSLPCNYAFLAYNLTRFYERGRYAKEYQPSDGYDASHFIDATVSTHLATDDDSFRETCELVPERTFSLLTSLELSDLLRLSV